MNIAICDDDKDFAVELGSIINGEFKKLNRECNINICCDSTKMLNVCIENKVDAVFLDISMPNIDGFQLAKLLSSIRRNIIIVFVTNNEPAVYTAIEYQPFAFVPKSQMHLIPRNIQRMIDKIDFSRKDHRRIDICFGQTTLSLELENIGYFMAKDHYVQYYSNLDGMSELYRCSLNDIESQLYDMFFVRCHRQYIVNCRAINDLKRDRCILFDDIEVPVSRSTRKNMNEEYNKYIWSKY